MADNNFLCNTLHGWKNLKESRERETDTPAPKKLNEGQQEEQRAAFIEVLEKTFEELMEEQPGRDMWMTQGPLVRIQSALGDLGSVEASDFGTSKEKYFTMRGLRQEGNKLMDAFRNLAGKLSQLYPESEVFKRYSR